MKPEHEQQRREAITRAYREHVNVSLRDAEVSTAVGLRRRKDGSPSARRPQATLPVCYWATILHSPDAYEEDGVEVLLLDYQARLIRWKQLGLYDGPTELTVVNRSSAAQDESTGDAT